jgi:hypothetical protein
MKYIRKTHVDCATDEWKGKGYVDRMLAIVYATECGTKRAGSHAFLRDLGQMLLSNPNAISVHTIHKSIKLSNILYL